MPETETENQVTDTQVTGQDIQRELMDMIVADESPSQISDRIKDMLYSNLRKR